MMKKIHTKTIVLFFGLLAFSLLGKFSTAHAAYSEEGTAFYAQAKPSAYAIEGTAFYAYTSQADGTIPVYRLLGSNGDHFYTASSDEKNASGYSYEGVAFYVYASQEEGTIPVYRLLNTTTGDHFYTASESEKDALKNNPQWGYTYEGPAFYVYSSQADGTSAVYRFFNGSTGDHFYTASTDEKNGLSLAPVYRFVSSTNGDHFYTASESEKNVVSNTSKSGYLFEGIAFYAYTTQVDGTSAVYRSLNGSNGDHFYTTSSSEKNASGYSYEGVAFYTYTSETNGATAVYRLFDSSGGDHFYTISSSEKDALLTSTYGPEISVGLWTYSKSDLKDGYFKIDANKSYNIKDKKGNILATVSGGSTTKVKYDSDSYFVVYGSISSKKVKTTVNFDAADGDNSSMIFNVHRPNSDYDEYRGKIKLQHYDSSNNWVINTLPLEQYVWGEGETTGTGDADHTRVMTIIFRTYGYQYLSWSSTIYMKYGFRIRSDSGSQIYYGYGHEKDYPKVKKAAQDTRAIIVTHDDADKDEDYVALTPYCSWSAGETRSYKEAWGSSAYPWCKSVDDPYGDYNNSYWGHSSTKSESTLISEGNHLVGLIAHGSLYLAEEKGWNYSKILKYYYDGIDLTRAY
ncbi:MAG: SpoIID/LytB domain-containing protein [Candidatus Moranbacteria bacterium]|nr:SpoIID/LytB domain-containing protein [Candidatus Moranbacteria bacterium]